MDRVLYELSIAPSAAPAQLSAGRFEKELLRVGRWVHPAKKFVLDVTRERLERWVENFKRMLARGIRVPVPYGHSYDARDNAGFVADMRVDGDSLVATLDIPREEDAARLGSTAAAVSVSLNPDYADGAGEKFGEVIEHVAITNYPVVPGQANFVPLDSAEPAAPDAPEIIRLRLESSPAAGDCPSFPAPSPEKGTVPLHCAEPPVSPSPDSLLLRLARLEEETIDREVEALMLSGKISPAVAPSVRRILATGAGPAGQGTIQLALTGQIVSPAEELRAILAALPAGAWVPVESRASAARDAARKDFEVTPERARQLGRENARILKPSQRDGS